MVQLQEILKKARNQPPPSYSAMRLIEVVADEDHSLAEVTRIVESDSTLTAQVLRIVNSVAYGLMQPVTTINRAVSFVGENMVVGLALASCAPQLFRQSLPGYESDAGELWAHSLRTAIASREVTGVAKTKANPEVAFTAGLLHDIGKSIMSHYLDGMTHNISERIDRGEVVDYLTAEREAFGIGHPGIGREMARAWGLPTVLEHVIGEHHRPSEAAPEYRSLVFAVHIGDIMAMMAGAATGADAMGYVLDAHWVDYYDMSQEQFEKMFLVVEQEFEKTRQAVFGAADG